MMTSTPPIRQAMSRFATVCLVLTHVPEDAIASLHEALGIETKEVIQLSSPDD